MLFLVRVLIDVIASSLPHENILSNSDFHFPRFFSSPFVITTLLILIFTEFFYDSDYASLRSTKYPQTFFSKLLLFIYVHISVASSSY